EARERRPRRVWDALRHLPPIRKFAGRPHASWESEVVTAPRGAQDGLRRSNSGGAVPPVEGPQADGRSVVGAVAGACLDRPAGGLGLGPGNGSRAAAPLARGNYVANENVDRRRSRLPRVEAEQHDGIANRLSK